MRLFRSTACLGICILFVGARSSVGRALRTTTFFGCEAGFAFESSGEAARCRRIASVLVAPMTECPQSGGVVLVERVDLAGNRDMCASAASGADVSVERACPPSYTKRVLPGRDRCELPTPEMIRAPSVPVAR